MAELNPDEQAMMDKARNTTGTTIPLGGDADGPPPSPETEASGQVEGVDVWGPYPDSLYKKGHVHVTTPTGVFGVPQGKQLYFEPRQWFSRKENKIITSMFPMYRSATEAAQIHNTPRDDRIYGQAIQCARQFFEQTAFDFAA